MRLCLHPLLPPLALARQESKGGKGYRWYGPALLALPLPVCVRVLEVDRHVWGKSEIERYADASRSSAHAAGHRAVTRRPTRLGP